MELRARTGKRPKRRQCVRLMSALTSFFANAKGGSGTGTHEGRFPTMKTLLIPALLLACSTPVLASEPRATPASQATPDIRIVRVTEGPKAADCEAATWPNIPPSCLQREAKAADASASLGK